MVPDINLVHVHPTSNSWYYVLVQGKSTIGTNDIDIFLEVSNPRRSYFGTLIRGSSNCWYSYHYQYIVVVLKYMLYWQKQNEANTNCKVLFQQVQFVHTDSTTNLQHKQATFTSSSQSLIPS